METGRKIIPGAAHPLPWKPKNGMCTEMPSPAGNLGGFIPNKRVGGFVPAVLLCQDSSFGCWCLVGDIVPQVTPPWSLQSLHVWILDIQSLGFFLCGVLGSALNPGFSGCPRSLRGPWAEQSRAEQAVPSQQWQWKWRFGSSEWICSRSWECLPRGALLLCPVGFETQSLQDVPVFLIPVCCQFSFPVRSLGLREESRRNFVFPVGI